VSGRATRAPVYSFAAAAVYSLVAGSQALVPDSGSAWQQIWTARRLYLAAVWDEAPHLAALTVFPLALLALRQGRLAAAVAAVAVMALASAFGPMQMILGGTALCLVWGGWWRTVAAGLIAWIVVIRYLPPSLILAMRTAAPYGPEGGWTTGSWLALAVTVGAVAAAFAATHRAAPELRFMCLFTVFAALPPLLQTYAGIHVFPQPNRYRLELDFALALLVPFGLRPLISRMPRVAQAVLCAGLIAAAVPLVIEQRRWAKRELRTPDGNQSIEAVTARWIEANLPRTRVMFAGSMALWANAFTSVPQLAGGSWSQSAHPVQLAGLPVIHSGPAEEAVRWLKAYGAGAVVVSSRDSAEFWKPYTNPEKFEGLLPVLWRRDGVTVYEVPRQSPSIAHVLKREPLGRLDRYVAALDQESARAAVQWLGPGRLFIRTRVLLDEVVSVQITYNPGWRARVHGETVAVHGDGLGLLWVEPGCNGSCEIELVY